MPSTQKPRPAGYVDTEDPLHQQLAGMSAEQLVAMALQEEDDSPSNGPSSASTVETEQDGIRAEALRRSRVRQLFKAPPGRAP